MILRLSNIVETALNPAMKLLPPNLDSKEARVLILAIGLQESRFEARFQLLNGGGKGPARGFTQFELGTRESKGGVWGVYLHSATTELLRQLCRDRDCNFDPRAIWARLEYDDVLALGIARLLLLTNPKPLPAVDAADAAWDYYLATWRPGQPKPGTWKPYHMRAREEVVG